MVGRLEAVTLLEQETFGFAGSAIYPSSLAYANPTLLGAVVNSDSAPTEPFSVTGPGAETELNSDELAALPT